MNEKENYIRTLNESLTYSVSKFDTQTLTISGASLAFSLTFIKDIVPFSKAICVPIFYLSLLFFLVTVFLGFYGHYMSMRKLITVIDLAHKEEYETISRMKDRTNLINASVITSLILGIFFLLMYCIINIEKERRNKKITVKNNNITNTKKSFDIKSENCKTVEFKDSLNTNLKK